MDVPVGSTVQFISPTENAFLEGYIVRKSKMKNMYSDYTRSEYQLGSDYGFSPSDLFYKIRVYTVVLMLSEKKSYHPPILCTVHSNRIKMLIDCPPDSEFTPNRTPDTT